MEINKNLCQPPEYTPDIIKDIYRQEIARALRINTILDILGDDYDLDHLRELVEADRDGRCVQFEPGFPVVNYYYQEDSRYIRESTGVVTKEEYRNALKGEQHEQ